MPLPRPLEPDALQELLAACRAGQALEVHPLAEDPIRASHRVRTSIGEYLLTRFAPGAAAQDLKPVLAWTQALAAAGLPCAAPLADSRGEPLLRLAGAPAVLRPWLPGTSPETVQPAQCEALGQALGRIHRLGTGTPGAMRPYPHGLRWWRDSARDLADRLETEDRALLEEEIRFQGLFRLSDLPSGPIHGAPLRFNTLFVGERLTGLTGWWRAGVEALLFDLAVAANEACSTPDHHLDPARLRALLSAYRAERPFSAMERGAWPVMLRAAALLCWLAGLTGLEPRLDPTRHRDMLRLRVGNRERLPL